MSLSPQAIDPVPEQTKAVAQAAFPNGNTYMKMRDEFGVFYDDELFSQMFPSCGQPALSPWRLALVTIMQYAENLTDRQAADAVRSRIDWKYALGLELTDCGFNFSVLSEFRSRLIGGEAESLLLSTMLEQFSERGLLSASGKQRTDATHVLAALHTLNRLELVSETLTHTLNQLATIVPDWLKAQVPVQWFDRYSRRLFEYRLPKDKKKRIILAETIGTDGHYLLAAIYAKTAPDFLRSLKAVETMRQIWIQHFFIEADTVHWREKDNLPPAALMICSPHDTDARYSTKRETSWIGYKVHLTETCDKEGPNLITHVQTTLATVPDIQVTGQIHHDLSQRELLPEKHIVDTAYIDGDLLTNSSRQYGINLVGPTGSDNSWRARDETAFDMTQFTIDWLDNQVVCPMGQTSRYWTETQSQSGKPKIVVQFDKNDCLLCSCRPRCTRSKAGVRQLTLSPQAAHIALIAARERQQTDEFKELYKTRAGIEGTISQGTNARGLRQCRYRGLAKTHLQHVFTAAAINLTRAIDWLMEKTPSQTRTPRFSALAA